MSDEGDLIAHRYRLIERIGGTAATVWRGRDEVLHRTVAIKLLGQAQEDVARRGERAVRTAAKLHHPNVVTVHDVVEHAGATVLVMEYVPGRTLAAMLAASGPLWPMDVAGIGTQVAAALAAAHELGILHRDVHPDNVLLAGNGVAKLAGFGLSGVVGDLGVIAPAADFAAYLAPELAAGGVPTPASDAFSFGVMLYLAVNGKAGPLSELLSRLLSVDPADRPSLADARDELRALSRGGAAWTRPISMGLAGVGADTAAIPTGTQLMSMTVVPHRPRRRFAWARATPLRAGLVLLAGVAIVAAVMLSSAANMSGAPWPAPVTGTPALPTTATSTPPTPLAVRIFLVSYYSLVTRNLDAAAQLLTPAYQQRTGGFAAYQRFYGTIASVKVQEVDITGPLTATVVLAFTRRNGTTSVERYLFTLVDQAGKLMIDGAQLQTVLSDGQ